MSEYTYPRPAVTVDIVVFGVDLDADTPLKVLLIRRARGLYKDRWGLPGGYIRMTDDPQEQGEGLEEAAYRELAEETGVQTSYLEQLCTFGAPGRDPRRRTLSVAYFALVNTADYVLSIGGYASDVIWEPVSSTKGLALDHDTILQVAVERLQAKVRYAPIGLNLLPEPFTLSQLHRLYEAVLGREVDKRNFYKRAKSLRIFVEAGTDPTPKAGRPAVTYRFDRDEYNKALKNGFNFEV